MSRKFENSSRNDANSISQLTPEAAELFLKWLFSGVHAHGGIVAKLARKCGR